MNSPLPYDVMSIIYKQLKFEDKRNLIEALLIFKIWFSSDLITELINKNSCKRCDGKYITKSILPICANDDCDRTDFSHGVLCKLCEKAFCGSIYCNSGSLILCDYCSDYYICFDCIDKDDDNDDAYAEEKKYIYNCDYCRSCDELCRECINTKRIDINLILKHCIQCSNMICFNCIAKYNINPLQCEKCNTPYQ
jgi:hypothetical protein